MHLSSCVRHARPRSHHLIISSHVLQSFELSDRFGSSLQLSATTSRRWGRQTVSEPQHRIFAKQANHLRELHAAFQATWKFEFTYQFCGQVNETDVYIKSSLYIDFYDLLCRLESLCFELNQGGSRFQGKSGLAKISAQEGCSYNMIYIYIHQFLKAARPEPIPELTSGHVIGSKNGCQSVLFLLLSKI